MAAAGATPSPTRAASPPHLASLGLDLEELRRESLRLAHGCVVGALLLAMVYVVVVDDRAWLGAAVLVVSLGATAWVGGLAARLGVRAAGAVLVLGIGVGLWATAHFAPVGVVTPWFALLPILANVLLGPRPGLLAAGLGTALIASLSPGLAGGAVDQVVGAILLTWGAAAVARVFSLPLYTALDWAWSGWVEAQERTEQLRDRQGELNRMLKTLGDTYEQLEAANRELERARRAAEDARRLKSEFAANISHELRTPLNLIIGFAEMMAAAPGAYGGERLPPAYRGDAAAIYRNARHLSGLIDDVLDLSQIEAGRMGLRREHVLLAEIVGEVVGAVAALFERKGLRLEALVPPDLPSLFVDRARIRQVLINLLGNAARFTDRGGATVAAEVRGNDVLVSVADSGPGIRAEDIPRVFEEFRQLDASLGRRHGGSGLGLTISKQFVELHGGSMWVESQPGEGSAFRFTLPLNQQVVAATQPSWETWVRLRTEGPGRRAVVVVDEDAGTARLFERYLDGYQVALVGRAEEARALAARSPVAGIVLVGQSSVEAWEQLRRLEVVPRAVPLAICAFPGSEDQAERLGVADYLVKPISREHLLAVLARLDRPVKTVLVADDDPEMIKLLSRMLRSSPRSYRVLKALGGVQALALMAETPPDLVILDLLMPDVDGYTVLASMRAHEALRRVPVVVVTARGGEADVISAGMMGLTREGGLSVGELMRCLKASLDALAPDADSARGPGGAAAG